MDINDDTTSQKETLKRIHCTSSTDTGLTVTSDSNIINIKLIDRIINDLPLSERDAARYLGVKRKTVIYHAQRLREISHAVIGKRRIYRRKDLDEFLTTRMVKRLPPL